MHSVKVILKNGNTFSGSLWNWKPKDGCFTLVDDNNINDGNPIEVKLDDVKEAVALGTRTGLNKVEDVDLLVRAENEGWHKKREPSEYEKHGDLLLSILNWVLDEQLAGRRPNDHDVAKKFNLTLAETIKIHKELEDMGEL